jgi:hypothetical protein
MWGIQQEGIAREAEPKHAGSNTDKQALKDHVNEIGPTLMFLYDGTPSFNTDEQELKAHRRLVVTQCELV